MWHPISGAQIFSHLAIKSDENKDDFNRDTVRNDTPKQITNYQGNKRRHYLQQCANSIL